MKIMKNMRFGVLYSLCLAAFAVGCSEAAQDPCAHNACGGCTELPDKLGKACNTCGTWVCDGEEAIKCEDPGKNACGGCGILEHSKGTKCDDGCGLWTCNDDGALECRAQNEPNACGGCKTLDGTPGESCGKGCGIWECDGTDAVVCSHDVPFNACGGCTELQGKKGESCNDACGTWVCDGKEKLECRGRDQFNACGGCTELDAEPGEPCDDCNQYVCDGTDALSCGEKNNRIEKNVCDSCGPLNEDVLPGEDCGECGRYQCTEDGTIVCDDPGKNICGGCVPLDDVEIGGQCGTAACAKWECNGLDDIQCGSNGANICGGCNELPLDATPGADCSNESSAACCTWECTDDGDIVKNEHAKNGCGGCKQFVDEDGNIYDKGSKCGTYGEWKCDWNADPEGDALKCECASINVNFCGGCDGNRAAKGGTCTYCAGTSASSSGKYDCIDTKVSCRDGNDTINTIQTLSCSSSYGDKTCDGSNFTDKDGSSDPSHKRTLSLIDVHDVDFMKVHIEDKGFAIMQPHVWIENAPAHLRLCVYPKEKGRSGDIYTCSGSNVTNDKMSVSAHTKSNIKLPDGSIAYGFCTTSTTAGTRFLRIQDTNTDVDLYIKVDSNNPKSVATCTSYTLQMHF